MLERPNWARGFTPGMDATSQARGWAWPWPLQSISCGFAVPGALSPPSAEGSQRPRAKEMPVEFPLPPLQTRKSHDRPGALGGEGKLPP